MSVICEVAPHSIACLDSEGVHTGRDPVSAVWRQAVVYTELDTSVTDLLRPVIENTIDSAAEVTRIVFCRYADVDRIEEHIPNDCIIVIVKCS